MLYLCLSLPQLPLEARQPPPDDLIAVVEHEGSSRFLIACSESCRAAGVRPGLAATTALALQPGLRLLERSHREEATALESLATWAEQFSSWVCFDAARLLLWIEIGSGLRYFGGIDEVRARVEQGLSQLGYLGYAGVAPTLEAAALLSQLDCAPVIRHHAQLLQALEPLPFSAMALDDEVAEALGSLGLRTVGDVLKLPRDGLNRRFQASLVQYLDRLTGRRRDPRKPFQAPATYRRRFELLGSVESTQGLLFPLNRMFEELQGFLVARDTAVQEIHLDLCHDGHEPTCLAIRTSRPMRDAIRLRALVRERLERVTLERAAEEIVLRVERFQPLGDTQLDLLDSSRQKDDGWEDLLDKLRARLGDGAVRQLGLKDDHRPERAWCLVDSKSPASLESLPEERPMWLLTPRPIRALPPAMGRPERIEAGWWDGKDEQRDYYTVEAPDSARWWVYREPGRDAWFLHGLWA